MIFCEKCGTKVNFMGKCESTLCGNINSYPPTRLDIELDEYEKKMKEIEPIDKRYLYQSEQEFMFIKIKVASQEIIKNYEKRINEWLRICKNCSLKWKWYITASGKILNAEEHKIYKELTNARRL